MKENDFVDEVMRENVLIVSFKGVAKQSEKLKMEILTIVRGKMECEIQTKGKPTICLRVQF